MKRSTRANQAQESLSILKRGNYNTPSGDIVRIGDDQAQAEVGTTLHTPEGLEVVLKDVLSRPVTPKRAKIELTGETTLEAARRLSSTSTQLAALNFASARNAGGGFLKGSQAQEESLARSSGLYPCLQRQETYYRVHRAQPSGFYTDHMIHAPSVPVFRDDEGALLEEPYLLSFITSPAVNAGVVRRKKVGTAAQIISVMHQRAAKMLALSCHMGHETLILGAWGCGVFKNDPGTIAEIFRDLLEGELNFEQRIPHIVFAVFDPDRKQIIRKAFETKLGHLVSP